MSKPCDRLLEHCDGFGKWAAYRFAGVVGVGWWMGYFVLISSCWLVTGVFRTWSVFHISLCCWFAQQPKYYNGLAAVQWFLSSARVQPPSVPRATIFHLSPSLRWGMFTTVVWPCDSRQYWPIQQYAMFWQKSWTTPLPFKTVLLPVGATNDLFTDAFHISNNCTIDRSNETCRYTIYTMADISVWKFDAKPFELYIQI